MRKLQIIKQFKNINESWFFKCKNTLKIIPKVSQQKIVSKATEILPNS